MPVCTFLYWTSVSIIRKLFKTNSSIHNINTRNKHHLHRPNANLSYFQKRTYYAGIKIVNSLPPSAIILKNDKAKFKTALRKYLHTHFFYSVDELFMCKDVFCKIFVVFYTVNLYICVYSWLVPNPTVFMIH